MLLNDLHNLKVCEDALNREYNVLTIGGYFDMEESEKLMEVIEIVGDKIGFLKYQLGNPWEEL